MAPMVVVMVMTVMMFAVFDKMHSGRRADRVGWLQDIYEGKCQESQGDDFFHGACWFIIELRLCRQPPNEDLDEFSLVPGCGLCCRLFNVKDIQ